MRKFLGETVTVSDGTMKITGGYIALVLIVVFIISHV